MEIKPTHETNVEGNTWMSGGVVMDSPIMYAMQRANGDWFAFEDHGRSRVPVFRSTRDAMSARMSNAGMLLFKPMPLNAHTIIDMGSSNDDSSVYFWLVDNPATDVNRGHLIEYKHLARLTRHLSEQSAGAGSR